MDGSGRRRTIIAAVALFGLVAAVGLASRAHTPSGGGHSRALDTGILLEYALLLIAAASIVVVPAAIYLFVMGQGKEEIALPSRGNWMLALLFTMTAFAVVAIVLLSTGFFGNRHSRSRDNPLDPLIGLAQKGARAPKAVPFDWAPVIVVSSLTLAGLGAAGFMLVRRREPRRPSVRIAAALALALDATLEDLRANPDPRRAVIAAYAQMERALARSGLPRKPSEAPREYLHRTLPAVGAGAASVERLTALFERAKFSPHAIDAEMKEEAIAALESLRDELRGSA